MPSDLYIETKRMFYKLSKHERSTLLNELKTASREGKSKINVNRYIREIKEELSNSINDNYPKDINNSQLNLIILKAKNAGVDEKGVTELERLAYQGLIKWANEYGYLSEQDEDFAVDHLQKFIEIVKVEYNPKEKAVLFDKELLFLKKKCSDNFYSDYIVETFERLTGLSI